MASFINLLQQQGVFIQSDLLSAINIGPHPRSDPGCLLFCAPYWWGLELSYLNHHFFLPRYCYQLHFFPNEIILRNSHFNHLHVVVVQLLSLLNMNCSTPGLPVHYHLPEFTQIHVHWISLAMCIVFSFKSSCCLYI